MKRVHKSAEPPALAAYRTAFPSAHWDALRDDGEHDGPAVYKACLETALQDQGAICAYCESAISSARHLAYRLEHVHPKSDTSSEHNWSLDWHNMLAVCTGGETADPTLHPRPANLSCDAHKNHLVNCKKLPEEEADHLLHPLIVPAFPNLFAFNLRTGELSPNDEACSHVAITPDHGLGTQALVQRTIDVLNLNCDRLCQERLLVLRTLDRAKKTCRKKQDEPQAALADLARHVLRKPWPAHFTTWRCLLGTAMEDRLTALAYTG